MQSWRDSKKDFYDFTREAIFNNPCGLNIDEEIYEYFLGCMPPIIHGSIMLCGEPYGHDQFGNPYYYAFENSKRTGNYIFHGFMTRFDAIRFNKQNDKGRAA